MKPIKWDSGIQGIRSFFLTHTVQMKHKINDTNPSLLNLLNPHGSDETDKTASLKSDAKRLLNPHGSDETHVIIKRLAII